MKKILITLVLSFFLVFKSFADEGMWLPLLLGQQVYNDMVKKGLKLTKEQLYSINKASLKDAIIIFGGGCTGEIVSAEGLIFTNHHCGYDAIASASTVEHNYLQNGFYAKNKGEEIPTTFICTIPVTHRRCYQRSNGFIKRISRDRQSAKSKPCLGFY